jgi:heat shock protein HtpX
VAEQRRSLAGRALAMLALFVGFYVLAIVVAGLLIAAPAIELALVGRLHTYLLVLSLVGLGILWSLVPRRREKWVDPGPRFTAETQPELTALVRRVADQVGQSMPAELYLLDDINAFVTTRGGVMGIGGHRVLAIGVPLLMILDEDELMSVLAHEFGHFHGGDTRLGPLIYRTRGTMQRTLNAASGFARDILKAYASFYLARSQEISRAQEFAADRLGAGITSPFAAAQALARLPHASAAFAYYRDSEYAPVLQAGRQPPYLAGYQRMLASTMAATDQGLSADVALGSQTQSRFDSHPTPLDRIRALGVDPREVVAHPTPQTPATSLLRDLAGVEAHLVEGHTGNFPSERAAVRWEDVGQDVLLPAWRSNVATRLLPAARQLSPASLPTSAEALADLGSAIYAHAGVTATRPEREATARQLCSQYLAVAAADAGWKLESLPGEPVRFSRGGETLDVLNGYAQVCAGELDVAAWHAGLREIGLSEVAANVIATPAEPADGALQSVTTAATAVHEPAPTATAEPPAQAGPAPLQYRGKPSMRRELVINGPTLQWGDRTIAARDVTAVGYMVVNNAYDARFLTPSGELKFHINAGKKQREAWAAVVRWSELYVEPRLVDQLLAQLNDRGSVEVGGVTFDYNGFTTRKGKVAWEDFAGTAFTGGAATLHRRADNLDGHVQVGAVGTHLKHGGVLVPQLCQAIIASRP